MKLVYVPPGEFEMGSPVTELDHQSSESLHHVKLSKGFYLGAHEVTVKQFRMFVAQSKYKTEAETDGKGGYGWNRVLGVQQVQQKPEFSWSNHGTGGDDHPVVNVTWNDALAFCEWLTTREKRQYRLPTEAEWEYSCRAGTKTAFSVGDDAENLTTVGNVADGTLRSTSPTRTDTTKSLDGALITAPVGRYKANAFGLYDMHGNVGEWCMDWRGDYTGRAIDPTGPATGKDRIIRGGDWNSGPRYCRSAARLAHSPSYRHLYVGFRVACARLPFERAAVVPPPTIPTPVPTPRERIEDSINLKMVSIETRIFKMGSPIYETDRDKDEAERRITFTGPIVVSANEITQSQFERVLGRNPSYFSKTGGGRSLVEGQDTGNFPVERVTWFDALEFCNELSKLAGRPLHYEMVDIQRKDESDKSIVSAKVITRAISGGYRLPTEAEWEFTCRAGTTTPFHFGETLNGAEANIDGTHPYGTKTKGANRMRTEVVGGYAPNARGLFDMHGNVSEWCQDWYGAYPDSGGIRIQGNPLGPDTGTERVLRGGAWNSHAKNSRSAFRNKATPKSGGYSLGFRVAR